MSAYAAEVGKGATFAGVDQGIDFTGKASVFALADGVITRLVKNGSGWPGQGALVVYRITSGPGKGRYVYVAEDFAPADHLKIGSTISAGDTLGLATGVGKAPGIETGWADANGHAFGSPTAGPTSFGRNFDAFVQALSAGKTPAPAPDDPGAPGGTVPGSRYPGTEPPNQRGNSGSSLGGIASDVGGAVTGAASGVLGGVTDWIQKEAATGLAYVVFTFLGIALILFGLADALGYSPARVLGGAGKPRRRGR